MKNPISVRDAYRAILSAQYCNKQRRDCSKDCSRCSADVDAEKMDSVYVMVLDLLRARDPMLYLTDDLTELKSILEGSKNGTN